MFEAADMTNLAEMTTRLVAACRGAARFDVEGADDGELCAAVLELVLARSGLDAFEGHVLATLERRGVCDREFGLSTAAWVADRTRVPRNVAHQRVRTATKLHDWFDQVDEALVAGRVSFEHAKFLADRANPRVIDGLAELQSELVEAAGHAPFEVWRQEVTGIVELLDQDGGHDPNADRDRNRLHLNPVGADTTIVSGELFGETALVVNHAIESEAKRLYRVFAKDHEQCDDLPMPAWSTLRALAWAEICRRAHTIPLDCGTAPAADITLVIHAERPHDVTTIDGATLAWSHISHCVCDGVFSHLIVENHPDGHDEPLSLGRTQRYANRAQRRALAKRDGGCVFPGCGSPVSRCDAHHIIAWEDGGPTDLPNLALLCRHHHGVTHRNSWTMQRQPNGTFTWTTPSGQTLHSHPSGEQLPAA